MQLTGTDLTTWEVDVIREMDRAWRRAYGDKKGSGRSPVAEMEHQGVGDYCNGSKVDECSKQFGTHLAAVCATCPD